MGCDDVDAVEVAVLEIDPLAERTTPLTDKEARVALAEARRGLGADCARQALTFWSARSTRFS